MGGIVNNRLKSLEGVTILLSYWKYRKTNTSNIW